MNPGKEFYKTCFTIHKNVVLAITGLQAEVWYRNSLLQNYFQFGKSDIDVTVLFSFDENLFKNTKTISAALQICPLIKEINFYYPFSMRHCSLLINSFELKKDVLLHKKVHTTNQSHSDQFIYLLRMFSANLNQKHFSERDVKKWSFHFNLAGLSHLTSSLSADMSRESLLSLICSGREENILKTLSYAFKGFQEQAELFDLFQNCEQKDLLLMLLPQHFCFADTELNPFYKNYFEAQMRWELWALMTQPQLFTKNGPGHAHMENVIKVLKKNDNDSLTNIAESFRTFISTHL